MPFLDEQELASLQTEIHDANVKKDELETELNVLNEEITKVKKSSRALNLFFAILAGAGLATAYFTYNNASSLNTNNSQVSTENISTIDDSTDDNSEEENITNIKTVEEAIADVKNGISGETIYSVQIGVFSKNKYSLLSETLPGIATQGNYFKYSLGLYKTLQEAQNLRKQLVKAGFRDAFVASYIDGQRQKIHTPD